MRTPESPARLIQTSERAAANVQYIVHVPCYIVRRPTLGGHGQATRDG